MLNLKDYWLSVLTDIFSMYDRATFITYFQHSAILAIEENNLIVWVSKPIFLNWHLEHSRDKIFSSVKKIDLNINNVIFKVDWSLENNDIRAINVLTHFPNERKQRKLPWKQEIKLPNWITSKILNSKYRLSNFIVWENSRMAYAVSCTVAKNPWIKYNPFFLYWWTWLWKTHLLQAIWNEVILENSSRIVAYVTSESFTNEVVESIEKRNMEKLRAKYRQVDVLIIDDIQFIAWKERTMEEFFHTFNTLYEASKQIIIASDRPPKDLQWMESRLVSRFESWMTSDIKMPDYETRLAILHEKAQNCYSLISWEIFEFIALNVESSVRELEWVLMQVIANIELQHKTPTLADIWSFIRSINKDKKLVWYEENKPILVKSIDDVISFVVKYFNLTISDLTWPKRTKDFVYPRQIAMYICRENLNQWLVQIWEKFWWRDHTSVMYSIKKVEDDIKKDPILKKDLRNLYNEMWIL